VRRDFAEMALSVKALVDFDHSKSEVLVHRKLKNLFGVNARRWRW
jgi:hypothetical protein